MDHLVRGNLRDFLGCLNEVETVATDFPSDLFAIVALLCLLLVLGNKGSELISGLDHKHLLHVCKAETIVGALSTARDLVPDSVHKLFNEEVVGDLGHVLLLL